MLVWLLVNLVVLLMNWVCICEGMFRLFLVFLIVLIVLDSE